jgi:pseudaminic acid synthase
MNINKMSCPYIIAEISGNHNGDINRAYRLIEAAKEAGADAVKLQTYTADTITIDHDGPGFILGEGLWHKQKLYDLYHEAHTPWDWHPDLFRKGKEIGISVFSSPFDLTAVDFLEKLNPPLYKIASFELVDTPLIKYVAKTGKPIIMSTGMASIEEIELAVTVAKHNGCTDLTLLHCVSAYPASVSDCNLATMVDLKRRFPGLKIGLSDHTLGTVVSVAAVALGAEVIEKHFTLSRADGGVDSAFSLEPEELKTLCIECRNAYLAIGDVNYKRSQVEMGNLTYRRSLYVVKDIQKGEKFTHQNVRSIRPGLGMQPFMLESILGKNAAIECKYGMPLRTEMIDEIDVV